MLLLDTCTLIWPSTDVTQLSARAGDAINDPRNKLYASAISAWEVGIGTSKQRLQLQMAPERWFRKIMSDYAIEVIDINWMDALRSTELPWIHSDPADRMIIASALSRQLSVVSPDREMPKYPGLQIVW